jgi:predicted CXXCH cytochrome family protein
LSQINDGRGRSARLRIPARRLVVALVLPALLVVPGVPSALDGEGPLPKSAKAVSTHAPYTAGDCALCHDLKKGAPPAERGDSLCVSCHEDAKQTHVHAPRKCTRCHNSHDSTRPKLLRGDLGKCKECHAQG